MANIRVSLEFYYSTEEDISEWFLEGTELKKISNLDEAIEVARAELITHSANDFNLKAYFEDSPEDIVRG